MIPIVNQVAKASMKRAALDLEALKEIVSSNNVKKVLKLKYKTGLKTFDQSILNQFAINSTQNARITV